MKKMTSSLLCLIIVLSLFLGNVYQTDINALTQVQLRLGDYIEFGEYNQEPILWQVVGFHTSGNPILWSEYIIDFLAFDGAESGVYGKQNTNYEERYAYGSNRYSTSNLYDWLNSSATQVVFQTSPPTNESLLFSTDVEGNMNQGGYATKPGFLSGFSLEERQALIEYNYSAKLSIIDEPDQIPYSFEIGKLSESIKNLEMGTSEPIESKVFLLSNKEVNSFVVNTKLDAIKTEKGSDEGQYYWLRMPVTNAGSIAMTVDYAGNIGKTDVAYPMVGVVPGIILNVKENPIRKGSGTISSPYSIEITTLASLLSKLTEAEQTLVKEHVLEIKTRYLASPNGYTLELITRDIEGTIPKDDFDTWVLIYQYLLEDEGIALDRTLFSPTPLLTHGNLKASIQFTDIQSLTLEQKSALDHFVQLGIIAGYEDGSFKPNKTVSRAELAKILTLLIQGSLNSDTGFFKDVDKKIWYYPYIEGIKASGYVIGYSDKTFLPNNTITFDEMSTILSRILQKDYGFYPSSFYSTDAKIIAGAKTSLWAEDHVALLFNTSVIEEGALYSGSTPMTRIQLITLMESFYRFIYQ